MQIESLKAFCDLVDTKSFTRAAHINGVSQSAISQTVSAMERRFKSLLIERSKRNFRVTHEGQIIYDYSKEILQTYHSLHHKLRELETTISGNIRVATIYSVGLHLLPPYVKRLMQTHPTINVRVEYRRANLVYEDVASNTVDLGLVAYPTRVRNLEIVPLRNDPLVLICHPQHAFAKRKSSRIEALAGENFVSFEQDIPTRRALDRLFKKHGTTVKTVAEFDNVETVKRAVELDSGMAIVPEATVKQEVTNHTLTAVPLEGKFARPLAIIHKKSKVLSPAMDQFIKLLKEPL